MRPSNYTNACISFTADRAHYPYLNLIINMFTRIRPVCSHRSARRQPHSPRWKPPFGRYSERGDADESPAANYALARSPCRRPIATPKPGPRPKNNRPPSAASSPTTLRACWTMKSGPVGRHAVSIRSRAGPRRWAKAPEGDRERRHAHRDQGYETARAGHASAVRLPRFLLEIPAIRPVCPTLRCARPAQA